MEKVIYDIGYGIEVESLHCRKCEFNITKSKRLSKAMKMLRDNMAKDVRIVQVGTGLGLRFPNEMAKHFSLQRGKELLLKPEADGIKVIVRK